MARDARHPCGGTGPGVVHLSTAAVEPRQRGSLMGDVMARQLAGGVVAAHGDAALHCDWTLASLAPGLVLGRAIQGGMVAERDGKALADDDADFSIFMGVDGYGRFEQNDRRCAIAPGAAVLVAHARSVKSWWPDSQVVVLRLPRAALPANAPIERLGGMLIGRDAPALRLLRAYVAALQPLVGDAALPPIAARHVAELATLVLDEAIGHDSSARSGPAAAAARLNQMRQVIEGRFVEPGLDMARVAAAIGVSERAGYAAFSAAGLRFSEVLIATRLDRAAERLKAGYSGRLIDLALDVGFSDLSHFHRRFRRRFGAAPNDMRAC